MIDRLQIIISIIASLIVTVVSIVQMVTLQVLAMRLIWVVVVFYIIGLIIRIYIQKKVFPKLDIIEEEEENVDLEDDLSISKYDMEEKDKTQDVF